MNRFVIVFLTFSCVFSEIIGMLDDRVTRLTIRVDGLLAGNENGLKFPMKNSRDMDYALSVDIETADILRTDSGSSDL